MDEATLSVLDRQKCQAPGAGSFAGGGELCFPDPQSITILAKKTSYSPQPSDILCHFGQLARGRGFWALGSSSKSLELLRGAGQAPLAVQ